MHCVIYTVHISFIWRRHPESNWGIKVLQTSALPLGYVAVWSGKRGSNSRPPPWQGDALPLSYFRIRLCIVFFAVVCCSVSATVIIISIWYLFVNNFFEIFSKKLFHILKIARGSLFYKAKNLFTSLENFRKIDYSYCIF